LSVTELALLGGTPVRSTPFPAYDVIGPEEREAVQKVLESGILSKYLGTWNKHFFGGPVVQEFERNWAERFGCRHAVAVNSCTSGLYAAVGAAGVGPGDEVICTPYTMVASVTAAIVFNAVPVFADIDPHTFNLTAETIAAKITERTKAIIVVHLFGQVCDMDPIMDLARKHGLTVIEDCAQSPWAAYKGRKAGTLGHIGVFSLNYHKHIHSGEGGVVTTNDDALAERTQMIRNHAEAVVEPKGVANIVNMIGFNFRLGEIEAAIGLCQLAKVEGLVRQRQDNVAYIERQLGGVPGLTPGRVAPGCEHVYYVHPFAYDETVTGLPRTAIIRALRAELAPSVLREDEGPLVGPYYGKPLYLFPMFQQMIAYGDKHCPFKCPHYGGTADYSPGICPTAETVLGGGVIFHELMRPPATHADLDDFVAAIHKVFGRLDALRDWQARNPNP
jgi:dTDP-4-amino-4,6-dideoxygalactose transaminase